MIEEYVLSLLFLGAFGIFIGSLRAVFLKEHFSLLVFNIFFALVSIAEFAVSVLLFIDITADGKYVYLFNVLGIDNLSATLLLITNLIFMFAAIFSIYYMDDLRMGSFSTLFFALQLGIELVLISAHFFVLFIAWELMVLTGYVLVVFDKNKESFEAGLKYLVLSSMGSLFVLSGLGFLLAIIPDFSFKELGPLNVLTGSTSLLGKLAISFFIIGFGVTAGIVALNQWLPDAHPAAPAPISAILSGLIVKVGIYALYRTLSLLVSPLNINASPTALLVILGLITMLEGNTMVLAQLQRTDIVDFKRILAYSTTVHLGYLLLVVGIQTELGQIALIYHIINHAVAKSLLFLISGYFIHVFHTRDLRILSQYGIGRNDKLLGFCIAVALFSLGGLPLTGGFVSKFLILATLYSQMSVATGIMTDVVFWGLFIAVINSVFAFVGYLWILKKLVFAPATKSYEGISTRTWVKWLFLLLALLIIALGIFPFAFIQTFS